MIISNNKPKEMQTTVNTIVYLKQHQNMKEINISIFFSQTVFLSKSRYASGSIQLQSLLAILFLLMISLLIFSVTIFIKTIPIKNVVGYGLHFHNRRLYFDKILNLAINQMSSSAINEPTMENRGACHKT